MDKFYKVTLTYNVISYNWDHDIIKLTRETRGSGNV